MKPRSQQQNILNRLNQQPKEIEAKVASYLTDEDYSSLRRTCVEGVGSRHINLATKKAKATWDKYTLGPSLYLSAGKKLLEQLSPEPYQYAYARYKESGNFNAFVNELKRNVKAQLLIAGVATIGSIGVIPALTSYPIIGLCSLNQYVNGAIKDYIRNSKHTNIQTYLGTHLTSPIKARSLPSEQKHNTNISLSAENRQTHLVQKKHKKRKHSEIKASTYNNRFFTPSQSTNNLTEVKLFDQLEFNEILKEDKDKIYEDFSHYSDRSHIQQKNALLDIFNTVDRAQAKIAEEWFSPSSVELLWMLKIKIAEGIKLLTVESGYNDSIMTYWYEKLTYTNTIINNIFVTIDNVLPEKDLLQHNDKKLKI